MTLFFSLRCFESYACLFKGMLRKMSNFTTVLDVQVFKSFFLGERGRVRFLHKWFGKKSFFWIVKHTFLILVSGYPKVQKNVDRFEYKGQNFVELVAETLVEAYWHEKLLFVCSAITVAKDKNKSINLMLGRYVSKILI